MLYESLTTSTPPPRERTRECRARRSVRVVPTLTEPESAVRATTVDPVVHQLLMRFVGALNRRRAYAASHPMVQAAEAHLHESATAVLTKRPVIAIGVAKTELLIDGEPYVTKGSFARELATRLHRRGVGAVTMQAGLPLLQVREMLAWLATEPAEHADAIGDAAPILSGISVTGVAYDQLTFSNVGQSANNDVDRIWHTLAQVAGAGVVEADADGLSGDGIDTQEKSRITKCLRDAIHEPDVAHRTAIAFMDLAGRAIVAPRERRERIGDQLNQALSQIGESSFGPVIRALGERALQQRFISQVVEVLPAAAIARWLHVAAQAQNQQMSHHMLRLLTKLSTFAEASGTPAAQGVFRGAAQELVNGWALDDPNPEEHASLLDRIAMHERVAAGKAHAASAGTLTEIESSRLVQMALEINVAGEDATAAAEAIVSHGNGAVLLRWTDITGDTPAADAIHAIATSEAAVRHLLLNEPVDRLEARALLERLDVTSTGVLLDVLEAAEARGTRMIVRQRLAEFGDAIVPDLLARLDSAPWYLIRNVLTLLQEISTRSENMEAGMHTMTPLLDHEQVQVRMEAFRVLILDRSQREAVIRHALRDSSERIVLLALQAVAEEGATGNSPTSLSRDLAMQLMAMVDSGAHGENMRARTIRAMSAVKNDDLRDWLIAHVTRKSRILRRLTLSDPTPTAVAALQALQRSYASDPIATLVIELARKEGHDRRWLARDTGLPVEHAP